MVKIETAVKITPEAPAGVAMQYMWLDGMKWPVPEEDHHLILKLEAFGEEMKLVSEFPDSEMIRQETTGRVVEFVWYGSHARLVANYIRERYCAR